MADERVTITEIPGGLVLAGDLRLRRVDHGMGSLPVLGLADKYQEEWLGDVLYDYLAPENPDFDLVPFGRVRITIERV
ncbi:MAG TPA: hypothetical protein VM537_21715 [Anaerolineae bacterium]|nr:hypothetical protein [Anaerolineae bacterium]